jgi:hypothetical protein
LLSHSREGSVSPAGKHGSDMGRWLAFPLALMRTVKMTQDMSASLVRVDTLISSHVPCKPLCTPARGTPLCVLQFILQRCMVGEGLLRGRA